MQRFADRVDATPYDLIFADPPYTQHDQTEDFAAKLLGNAALVQALNADGLFVLEKSPRHPVELETNGWLPVRQKRYGTTEVVFLRRA